jgi:hypothetical protein
MGFVVKSAGLDYPTIRSAQVTRFIFKQLHRGMFAGRSFPYRLITRSVLLSHCFDPSRVNIDDLTTGAEGRARLGARTTT